MFIKITKFSLIFAALLALSSCNLGGSKKPLSKLEYLEGASKFDIDKFFNSDLSGFAIILNAEEKVIDKIEIKSTGSWSGKKGTVKFEYIYKNNRKDYRTWLITKKSSEKFSIVGHDFVGSAAGRQNGNVSEMLYKMSYKFNGQEKEINFTDTLYQINKNSVIAITELRFRGKKIGKIISSLSKEKNKAPAKEKIIEASKEKAEDEI